GGYEFAEFNFHFGEVVGDGRVDRFIEFGAHLHLACGPGPLWLWGFGSGVGKFVDFADALRAGAPIGIAAVTANVEIAPRGNRGVHREHVEPRDEMLLADVAARRFGEFDAPDFSARFAADERIS